MADEYQISKPGTFHGRSIVVSPSVEPDGTHVCLLSYLNDVPDDDRELWRGIGVDFRSACDAAWRAFWKYQDALNDGIEFDPDEPKDQGHGLHL